jgi:hypothetical protein
MEGNRAVVTAALVVALILVGWWVVKRSNPAATVQLIDRFAQAKKEPNEAALYSVLDATLDGETRRAIAIAPTIGTRLTFRIEVPDDGWLNVWLGLKPEAWTQEGDGVLFHVGISDGRAYEQLFSQHLHPFANDGDRKWIQAMVDLSAYSGDEVDLIFNTRSGKPEKGDVRADYALWGEPTVIQR